MTAIPNSNSILLRDPNLIIPGRKPFTPVKIDWSHRLTDGLVFAVVFMETQRIELVSNRLYTLRNTAYIRQSSLVTTTGGDNSAHVQAVDELYETVADISIVWKGRTGATLSNNAAMCSIPYDTSAPWSGPWNTFDFLRNGSTTEIRLFWATAGGPTTYTVCDSASGAISADTESHFGVSLEYGTSGDCRFFVNGSLHSNTSPTSNDPPYFGGQKLDVVVNSNDYQGLSTNESMQGRCDHCYIWNRPITDKEHSDIYDDPYQFLMPV